MSLALRLDKRVTIQVQAAGQDAAGQPLPAGWVNLMLDGDGKVWAGIRDINGREFAAAGATQNQVVSTITIRYRAGIEAKMRILHGSLVYNIEAVLGQDGRTLALMCSKGTL
ncbi:phage head closure protein [Janthinobacterium sp. SUN073]|uniref:phage head closure protein n=1 Tax=Janthinobacterium sp. SUN073 TaxID=3004102 RepID=UPI0025B19E94|nr:phage head closure protein [Janthinobacterium sp. SUN073]MDN2699266.1 phage head closure protein [Janthinobacterium sp. SUN073]